MKKYNTISLLLFKAIEHIRAPFLKTSRVRVPKKIGSWTLAKTIKINNEGDMAVAQYKDKSGKKVIAKIWEAPYKNYSYFSLVNEANIYKSLTSVNKRLKGNTPPEYKNIHIPSLIKVVESKNRYILLIEWVSGKSSQNISTSKKIEMYKRIVAYINYLGSEMNSTELSNISNRSLFDYIILYPFLLLTAIVVNPSLFFLFLKSAFQLFVSVSNGKKAAKLVFSHRDLHFDNILTANKNIYLIDMELCAFTYPLYEQVTTLLNIWNDKPFRREFLKMTKHEHRNEMYLLKPMIIYCATHALTTHNFSKEVTNFDKEFLEYGINL